MKYLIFDVDNNLQYRFDTDAGNYSIPPQAIEVDEDIWFRTMQETDGVWRIDEGKNVFKAPFPSFVIPTPTKDEIEEKRLIAYAHPITGSDRYFAEAMSMVAEGLSPSSQEVKDIKAKGIARKVEIQALFPYPAE